MDNNINRVDYITKIVDRMKSNKQFISDLTKIIKQNNTDNNITNLRLVTHLENHKNKKIASNNTSGHRGVSFCKRANKWKASIHVNQKKKHLGFFKNKEDAILVRQRAEKEYGYHENHGRLINGDS